MTASRHTAPVGNAAPGVPQSPSTEVLQWHFRNASSTGYKPGTTAKQVITTSRSAQNAKGSFCPIYQTGVDTTVIPTQIGQMVKDRWERTAQTYPGVKIDYYCLMPNHLHGIIIIENQSISLSEIVRSFKSVTTREYNKLVSEEDKNTLWQSSFYDEIIRNDEMLYNARKYIFGNPSKWLEDSLYVE